MKILRTIIRTSLTLGLTLGLPACDDNPHDVDDDSYVEGDCNPDDPSIHPGAPETPYDDIDQDCRDGDLVDVDGDRVPGALGGGTDCNDDDSAIHPGATEIAYDGIDQDCRDGDLVDTDHDSFASTAVDGGRDCRDDDPLIHPGAIELPDGVDQDCDQIVDDGTFLFDDDGDGTSEVGGDCNDFRADIHSGADDIPGDGIDQDCSGEDLVDEDLDGFTGAAYGGPDCDDHDAAIHPGAAEIPDHIDNNCSGTVDENTEIFDDDLDQFSEAQGDCNDFNPAIHPGAADVVNGLDDDCDLVVDEPNLALAAPVLESLTPTTTAGSLSSTPGDLVYRPASFIAMDVRYVVRDPSGAVRDQVSVQARPLLPPRFGLPGAPVRAYTLASGVIRWVVEGGPVPAGASEIGQVELAPRVALAAVTQPGDHIERWYVGRDAQGREAALSAASLTITPEPAPLVEESGVLMTLHGNDITNHDLPSFADGDLLLITNLSQEEEVEADWNYDCTPAARPGGGLRLRCETSYDDSNGRSMFARAWRFHSPARVRCVTEDQQLTSCAVPPTIVVANDSRWTAFLECPIGFACTTIISPLGERPTHDDDFGWSTEVVAIDPIRDLGAGGVTALAAASNGALATGYIANLRGDVIEIRANGGNDGSYARFTVAQVLVPLGSPIAVTSRTFRSLERTGMNESRALCVPPGADDPIVAPIVTTYDPHYEHRPGPSLLSRIGGVIEATAGAAQQGFEVAVDISPGTVIGAARSVYGLIGSLIGLFGGGPESNHAAITHVRFDPTPGDPTCVDLHTVVRFTDDSEPQFEHGVTVVSVVEQP